LVISTFELGNIRFVVARAGLVLLFLGITVLQLFSFPGQFQHMRRTQGWPALYEVALTLAVGLWLLCGQIALIYLLRLVGAMKASQFFSHQNLIWIQRLLFAFKGACVMPMVLFLLIAPKADDPGILVLLTIVTLFIFSLTAVTSLLKEQIATKMCV
jgi:hypothetical protein